MRIVDTFTGEKRGRGAMASRGTWDRPTYDASYWTQSVKTLLIGSSSRGS